MVEQRMEVVVSCLVEEGTFVGCLGVEAEDLEVVASMEEQEVDHLFQHPCQRLCLVQPILVEVQEVVVAFPSLVATVELLFLQEFLCPLVAPPVLHLHQFFSLVNLVVPLLTWSQYFLL